MSINELLMGKKTEKNNPLAVTSDSKTSSIPTRFYAYIMTLFVALLLISNIASTKILLLGPFTFDGGTILFPLTYIFSDILTEVYGYSKARKVVWMGFFCTILMTLVFAIVQLLPAAVGWENQAAYELILGLVPRIVLASMIAYLIGSFTNDFILAKMKIITKGKYLWTRTVGSTLIGEMLDTSIFCTIAFLGVLPIELLLAVIVSNYLFKVGVEVLFTPITYKIINFLKKKENIDYYDIKTNFNPFVLK